MTTILIVDDEFDMRLLVRTVLELNSEGLQVVAEANDGHEALDVWRNLEGPPMPDVVVLDNRMPGLTGLDVAEQILTERPGQLVVLFSAFLDRQLLEEAASIGVAACVSKADVGTLPQLIARLAAGSPCSG